MKLNVVLSIIIGLFTSGWLYLTPALDASQKGLTDLHPMAIAPAKSLPLSQEEIENLIVHLKVWDWRNFPALAERAVITDVDFLLDIASRQDLYGFVVVSLLLEERMRFEPDVAERFYSVFQPRLMEALDDVSLGDLRGYAIELAGWIQNSELTLALTKRFLKETNPVDRARFALALSISGNQETADQIKSALMKETDLAEMMLKAGILFDLAKRHNLPQDLNWLSDEIFWKAIGMLDEELKTAPFQPSALFSIAALKEMDLHTLVTQIILPGDYTLNLKRNAILTALDMVDASNLMLWKEAKDRFGFGPLAQELDQITLRAAANPHLEHENCTSDLHPSPALQR